MQETILVLLERYGLVAIAIAVALEYACFPISSEVLLPLSGAVAAGSGIGYLQLLGASTAAGIAGSMACYQLGRWGGDALLGRITRRFPGAGKGIEAARKWLARGGIPALFLCRLIPLCRTYVSLVAGIAGVERGLFAAVSSAGILIWNAALLATGYFVTSEWEAIRAWLAGHRIPLLVAGVVLAGALPLLIRLFRRKAAPERVPGKCP